MQNDFHNEIERKFLVKEINFDLTKFPSDKIIQGYISNPEDELTIRLRKVNNRYFKTIKKRGFISRLEKEFEISEDEFNKEWHLTLNKRIHKTRFKIPHDKFLIELDFFHDKLEGLKIAEVEFNSIKESKLFTPLDWFGEEVTNKKEFSNSYLSLYGIRNSD